MSRRKHEISDSLPVDFRLVKSACGDVKPCLGNVLRAELLFETIDGIAVFLIYPIVSAYPFCGKIACRQKPRFKKRRFGRLALDVVFVPERNAPFHAFAGFQFMRIFRTHRRRLYFAAIPHCLFVRYCDYAIRCLRYSAVAVPHKTRILYIYPHRSYKIFTFKIDRFHILSLPRKFCFNFSTIGFAFFQFGLPFAFFFFGAKF